MKSISIVAVTSALSLFASTAFAGPIAVEARQTPTVRIALGDGYSGAWANVEIPLNYNTYQVYDLWKDTSVQHGGAIRASTADMTTVPNTSSCVFRNEGGEEIGRLYTGAPGAKTHLKFGSPDMVDVISLTTATITCQPYAV